MSRYHSEARPKPADIRGAARLAADAVSGVTGIVHHMHRNILARALPFPDSAANPVTSVTDLVYRAIYGTTRLVGTGLNAALAPLDTLHSSKQRAGHPTRNRTPAVPEDWIRSGRGFILLILFPR